jgi:putative endonuclease
MASWFVYIVECADGTLYTGVTTDLPRRLRSHAAGTASRYTRARRPVHLVHREEVGSREDALRREAWIKKLDRRAKLGLVGSRPTKSTKGPAATS